MALLALLMMLLALMMVSPVQSLGASPIGAVTGPATPSSSMRSSHQQVDYNRDCIPPAADGYFNALITGVGGRDSVVAGICETNGMTL